MMTKFADFIQELHDEAVAEGPEAVAEFEAFDAHFMLGAQLLRRRKELGLTQTALAEASGVPQPEISRIERGSSNSTLATLTRILKSLGSGPQIVLSWSSEPHTA